MTRLPVKPVQFLKALFPIVVTELPMVKLPVKPLQLWNALVPMAVTEFGMIKSPVRPVVACGRHRANVTDRGTRIPSKYGSFCTVLDLPALVSFQSLKERDP